MWRFGLTVFLLVLPLWPGCARTGESGGLAKGANHAARLLQFEVLSCDRLSESRGFRPRVAAEIVTLEGWCAVMHAIYGHLNEVPSDGSQAVSHEGIHRGNCS